MREELERLQIDVKVDQGQSGITEEHHKLDEGKQEAEDRTKDK